MSNPLIDLATGVAADLAIRLFSGGFSSLFTDAPVAPEVLSHLPTPEQVEQEHAAHVAAARKAAAAIRRIAPFTVASLESLSRGPLALLLHGPDPAAPAPAPAAGAAAAPVSAAAPAVATAAPPVSAPDPVVVVDGVPAAAER